MKQIEQEIKTEGSGIVGGTGFKPFRGLEVNVSSRWVNPWEKVFQEEGIPEDFRRPYFKFDYILDRIMESRAETVLDVAMGPGRHAVAMAKEGLSVYGFDASRIALELAEKELEKQNLSCDLAQADMFGGYPYADNSIDAVVAIQAIYHGYRGHMEKALAEIHRVIKPGGIFGFTVSLDYTRATLGAENCKVREMAPRTFIPLVGREKGLPHFYPSEDQLGEMLYPNFKDIDVITDLDNSYRLVIAEKQ